MGYDDLNLLHIGIVAEGPGQLRLRGDSDVEAELHSITLLCQHMTTNCAIYLRVSLDATGQRLAVDRQLEDCLRIAHDRGWSVVDQYVDNAISASSKTKQRPDYNRLVSDYADGRFDALVCYDLDRLTRQPRQLEDWIDAAEERGLRLVTANGEAGLFTDGGRLFARIKASVARAEIERKSARQRRALQQRADKGRPPLGVRLTGYTVKGEVVPTEATVIAAIFARFTAGDSLRGIAEWLNGQPIKTRNGNVWNPSTIRTILLNPRYAGRAVYRGEVTGKLGDWEPIVSEETFDSAQAILHDPRRITNRLGTDRRYLGAGLYVCGVCGQAVRSHSGGRYRCAVGGHVVRAVAGVDSYVNKMIARWLERPDLADTLNRPNSAKSDALGKEVTRLRQRIEQFERDYDDGLIDGKRLPWQRRRPVSSCRRPSRRGPGQPRRVPSLACSSRRIRPWPLRTRHWERVAPSLTSTSVSNYILPLAAARPSTRKR
jgi:site-specific DNA recombinase